ncbi:MAG: ABC transporter permease [Gemmatimonadaceae bacterium]
MGKMVAVIKREYLERVRSKWFVFATVFGPVMMAVLTVLPAYMASSTRPSSELSNIVILDASGAGLGARIAQQLGKDGGAPRVRTITPSEIASAESLATREVIARDVEGYLVVDALTQSGERARYSGRNASTIPDTDRLQEATRTAVLGMRFEAAGLDAAKVQSLSTMRLKLDTERLTEQGRGSSGKGNIVLAYIVALLLYMSIVLYGQSILMGVIEEKTQRVAEVVVASIPSDKLLAGKVLGVGAVGLTQQVVWVASGILLLANQQTIMQALGLPAVAVQMPQVSVLTGAAFFAYFILGFIFFTSLFAAAGSMVSSTQDAQQVATPLTFLIIPSILLLTPVLLQPNGVMARVVTLVPFTSPILMPVRMSITAVPWWEVAASIAILIATCLGAIWLAARIYRVGVLMYGKKPSLREVSRWIRLAR